MKTAEYQAGDFSMLLGMRGFSDVLLNNHFKLYQGYVKNTNLLASKLKDLLEAGKTDSPEYAELKRRFGFEFNGMRLHEYYFGNLGGEGVLDNKSDFYRKAAEDFGTFENWKIDFTSVGSMRGIGWVVLYQDPKTGRLFNTWINEHETGHLAGAAPILVMDVFEKVLITDYGLDRKSYIKAFFENIEWKVVNERLK